MSRARLAIIASFSAKFLWGKNYFANIYLIYLKTGTIKDFVVVRVSMVLDVLVFFSFLAGK